MGLFSRDKEFIFTSLVSILDLILLINIQVRIGNFKKIKDLSIINMEKYMWLDVNLTSFQIVNPNSLLVKNMVKDWMVNEFKGLNSPLENEKTFRVGIFLFCRL